jgi:hypothetical protein
MVVLCCRCVDEQSARFQQHPLPVLLTEFFYISSVSISVEHHTTTVSGVLATDIATTAPQLAIHYSNRTDRNPTY